MITDYYIAAWCLPTSKNHWTKDYTLWKCEHKSLYFHDWYYHSEAAESKWRYYGELPNTYKPSHVWLDPISKAEAFAIIL